MFDRELKIETKRGQYDTGDIIVINNEKWIVTTIHYGVTDHIICRPLLDVVISTTVIHLRDEPQPFTLSDYIEHLIGRIVNERGVS